VRRVPQLTECLSKSGRGFLHQSLGGIKSNGVTVIKKMILGPPAFNPGRYLKKTNYHPGKKVKVRGASWQQHKFPTKYQKRKDIHLGGFRMKAKRKIIRGRVQNTRREVLSWPCCGEGRNGPWETAPKFFLKSLKRGKPPWHTKKKKDYLKDKKSCREN